MTQKRHSVTAVGVGIVGAAVASGRALAGHSVRVVSKARGPAFQAFEDLALRAGWLVEWWPWRVAVSLPLERGAKLLVSAPEMPALCRQSLSLKFFTTH
jgi:hypothetical protein